MQERLHTVEQTEDVGIRAIASAAGVTLPCEVLLHSCEPCRERIVELPQLMARSERIANMGLKFR